MAAVNVAHLLPSDQPGTNSSCDAGVRDLRVLRPTRHGGLLLPLRGKRRGRAHECARRAHTQHELKDLQQNTQRLAVHDIVELLAAVGTVVPSIDRAPAVLGRCCGSCGQNAMLGSCTCLPAPMPRAKLGASVPQSAASMCGSCGQHVLLGCLCPPAGDSGPVARVPIPAPEPLQEVVSSHNVAAVPHSRAVLKTTSNSSADSTCSAPGDAPSSPTELRAPLASLPPNQTNLGHSAGGKVALLKRTSSRQKRIAAEVEAMSEDLNPKICQKIRVQPVPKIRRGGKKLSTYITSSSWLCGGAPISKQGRASKRRAGLIQ